jgi:UDP-glucuronate decarboxylase
MTHSLVTGATGFLGTHLCLRLLVDGHRVTGVDNFYTGTQHNLALLQNHANFDFVRGDIIDPLPDIKADHIYNLACPASPPHYQRDPVYTLRTCVWGTFNLLDLARRTGAKMLQASTSEVYGDPDISPQPETYRGAVNITGIRSCYDEGKRAAETLCADFARQYKTRTKIMRIFNTYGPYMDPADGRVVSNFIVQALRGQNLTVYGDGSQTRSFCYADDLIDGMVRLMNAPDDVTGPVNIGNPAEFTMLQLAQMVRDRVPGAGPVVYRDLPSDDPKQRRPDIALATAQLGWAPRVVLADGLDRTIAWFSQYLSAQSKTGT